ncbi:MAG: S8 family peptidase [Chthoniobacterales bacterium]|nr:S8 family peptidase [Chthoniobacterales bacterium]
MPDRPLIVLPSPAAASRGRPPGGGGSPHLPSRARQGQRIGPKFETLKAYFEQRAVEFRASAAGQVPEEVIVFETVGSVANFLNAARLVPGLDFLAEWDVEDIAPDNDFYNEAREDSHLSGRVFLVMTNQQALQQLLSLWLAFQSGRTAARGLSPFFDLFQHLRDVRRWSPEDRLLETGVIEYWKDAATTGDDTIIPFEVELWFRQTAQQRAASVDRIRQIVTRLRGQVASVCELDAICYHAAVVTMPASEVRRLVNRQEVELLGESAVMFFRPSGQSVMPGLGEPDLQAPVAAPPAGIPSGEPTVALLDGLPLENHARLVGRLRVDDPDGYASAYSASEREHGTTMASIIVHGDLNAPRAALPRPLYQRPILRPDPQLWNSARNERVPHGINPLDLTHRAVRRLFETDGATPPVAPSVRVINFSIGDPLQQFHSAVSAWGRLLDWLAAKYNVLFCVSAGNHAGALKLDVPHADFAALTPQDREAQVLKALERDLRLRRILAPADSINAVTVGAWHHDFGAVLNLPHRLNPLVAEPLPSPVSGLGCGFRNSTKPDILLPGGRQFYSERLGNSHANATLDIAPATVAPGILAAAPSTAPGQVDREKHTRGTSNATALATRSAAFLYEQLVSLRAEPGGDRLTDEFAAVLLKAMLIHTAAWGAAYDHLRGVLKPAAMREDKFKRIAARFLGFGFVEPVESLVGADHRATMLGCGTLASDGAHEYRIPLPPSLSGVRGLRRIVVTLAWLSPIHPRHRNYRGAALWFDIENQKLATKREDAEWRSARNGTVQHEIFEGERAAAFAEDATMVIRVNCRADATALEGTIRYGLVVSIEVAEELRVPVYEEIAARIHPPVAVGTPVP